MQGTMEIQKCARYHGDIEMCKVRWRYRNMQGTMEIQKCFTAVLLFVYVTI